MIEAGVFFGRFDPMRSIIIAAMLLAGAPALAQSGGQASGRQGDGGSQSDPDRLICKRFAETGSLVKKRKVCYTAREWTVRNDAEREAPTTWVEGMRSKPSGE